MNFEEKLGMAKDGNRAAYESLCLNFADKLYAAALLSLKNGGGAEKAVSDAIDEGFESISRIKDERHLCSWLVHELTKFIVDMLKEYKANGTVHMAPGSLAAAEKMPDVERLVFAIASVFGYSAREVSVLLGMPENAVNDKLASAKQHLGSGYDRVMNAIRTAEAPEKLKERLSAFDKQNEQRSLADILNMTENESEAVQETDSAADKPYSPEIPTAVLFADDEEEPAKEEPAKEEPAEPEEESVPEEEPAPEPVPEPEAEEPEEEQPEDIPEESAPVRMPTRKNMKMPKRRTTRSRTTI